MWNVLLDGRFNLQSITGVFGLRRPIHPKRAQIAGEVVVTL